VRLPILPALVLLAAASSARAEGPEGPESESDLMDALAKASLRVSKALKENEEALARLARGEAAAPKAVDIDLPREPVPGRAPAPAPAGGGAGGGGEAAGGAGGALRGSESQGREVVAGIDELLRVAMRLAKTRGAGGGGGRSSRMEEGDEDGDSKKPQNRKMGREEKKDPLEDQAKGDSGRPESPEKSSAPKKDAVPPSSDAKRPRSAKEMAGVFYAKLPDKVREAVLNGDFDQVPEKYRDLIREWTKALSESDTKEREAAGDGR
jgi:hypothetical protein